MNQTKLPTESEWFFDPKDFAHFLWSQKFKLVAAFFVGAAIGYLYSLTLADNFRVSATILPQQASESRMSSTLSALGGLVGDVGGGGDANAKIYPVIFKSRRVLGPVLEVKYGNKSFKEIFSEKFHPKKNVEDILIGIVQKKIITISVDRQSGVTTLVVEYPDPVVASAFANALLSQLDHFFKFQYQTSASQQKRLMETRMQSVTDSLNIMENRLASFLNRNRSYEHSPDLTIAEMRLRRDLDVQSTLYKELLRQREALKFNEISINPVLNVLDEAVPAIEKFAPIRRKIAAITGIVVLLISIALLKLFPSWARLGINTRKSGN